MANEAPATVPRELPRVAAPTPAFPGGFTVLMAVYHRDDPDLFVSAVESVYANSLRPDDFVLVVDGPVPERLREVIRALEARYALRVEWLPENLGLARALNHGLGLVGTEWIVRADADDLNVLDRFERQAAAIAAAGGALDLVGGAIAEVDRDGALLAIREVPLDAGAIRRRLVGRNPFNHMTVAFRTASVRDAGGYPDIPLKEDYGLWATLIARGARCANLPDVLVRATTGRAMYRRRGGAVHARSEWSLQQHLFRLGHKSRGAAIAWACARAGAAFLPAAVRGWIYENLLRKSPPPGAITP